MENHPPAGWRDSRRCRACITLRTHKSAWLRVRYTRRASDASAACSKSAAELLCQSLACASILYMRVGCASMLLVPETMDEHADAKPTSTPACCARATIQFDAQCGCPLRLPQPGRPVAVPHSVPRPVLPVVPVGGADGGSFSPQPARGRPGLRFGLLQRIDRPPHLIVSEALHPWRHREAAKSSPCVLEIVCGTPSHSSCRALCAGWCVPPFKADHYRWAACPRCRHAACSNSAQRMLRAWQLASQVAN